MKQWLIIPTNSSDLQYFLKANNDLKIQSLSSQYCHFLTRKESYLWLTCANSIALHDTPNDFLWNSNRFKGKNHMHTIVILIWGSKFDVGVFHFSSNTKQSSTFNLVPTFLSSWLVAAIIESFSLEPKWIFSSWIQNFCLKCWNWSLLQESSAIWKLVSEAWINCNVLPICSWNTC